MRYRWIFTVLLLALLLSACGKGMVPEAPDPPPSEEAQPLEPEPEPEPEDPAESALEKKLEEMSLEAKVGQLFFVQVPAENAAEDVMTYHLGGFILFGRDTQDKTASELIQTIRSYQEAAGGDTGIPLLVGVDEEGGSVVRVSSNPKLRSKKFSSPKKLWQGGSDDGVLALAAETGEKSALLKALGFNVNLSPVADVSENPSDFIYDRTTGGSAYEAHAYVCLVVTTQSRHGLGSVLKHFPGYGDNKDTHTGVAVDERPMETFLERDFFPFQGGIAVGEGSPPMPAVLVSHTVVKCMDPDLPASLSPEVHRILREELAFDGEFDGVVMTDDLSMGALSEYAKDGAVAVMALRAGNDLVVTSDYRSQIPRVIQAVKSGELEEAVIDAACRRVLRWKMELGLLSVSENGTLESALVP